MAVFYRLAYLTHFSAYHGYMSIKSLKTAHDAVQRFAVSGNHELATNTEPMAHVSHSCSVALFNSL